ncbi:hypothetical protein FWH13_02140 [Candidatus Saccharibacteria bacterium]|nr:hypothetical protein [Candidatus Saccharibacteria bacterium]
MGTLKIEAESNTEETGRRGLDSSAKHYGGVYEGEAMVMMRVLHSRPKHKMAGPHRKSRKTSATGLGKRARAGAIMEDNRMVKVVLGGGGIVGERDRSHNTKKEGTKSVKNPLFHSTNPNFTWNNSSPR